VIAFATSFPILEGKSVTCWTEVLRGVSIASQVLLGCLLHTRPQGTRFYASCWPLRGCFMSHTGSKSLLAVRWRAECHTADWASIRYIWQFTRVRVRTNYRPKKKACPARGPKQDREILRGCMSRSPYKSQASSEDKVAVLWKSPATRNPRT